MLRAIGQLASDQPPGDIKHLTSSSDYRLRVGDWRIVFRRDQDVLIITVVRVAHRSTVYDR